MRIQVIGGYPGGSPRGTKIEGAVVVTFTAKADGIFPFGVTEATEGVQVARDGAPVQLSATIPLNTLTWVTCKLYVAGCPALMIAVLEPPVATSIVKSLPVPFSATACGLPEALSVIVTLAARFPAAVGLKVTLMEQFAPAATLPPHVLVSEKSPLFVPVIAMLSVNAAFPVFVNVAFFAALLVPTSWLPRGRLVADKLTFGAKTWTVRVWAGEVELVNVASPL
jgi:hypothetical protein